MFYCSCIDIKSSAESSSVGSGISFEWKIWDSGLTIAICVVFSSLLNSGVFDRNGSHDLADVYLCCFLCFVMKYYFSELLKLFY